MVPGVSQIDAGYNFNCMVLVDNTIRCWGMNDGSELGDGTGNSSAIPVVVKNINNAVSVSAGGNHACAVLSDKTIKCWGNNYSGQGGIGTLYNTIPNPSQTSGITTAVAVSAGRFHTCAVLENGNVLCWGDNTFGQIGVGSSSINFSTPQLVTLPSKTVALAAGNYHTCALMDTGSIQCWGYNYTGQLGNRDTNFVTQKSPVWVLNNYLLGGINAVAIAAGQDSTCAIMVDKTVQCWGSNDYGLLGKGSNIGGRYDVPQLVSNLSNADAITIGASHACAKLSNGKVYCWGKNTEDQANAGSGVDPYYSPVEVTGVNGASMVSAGNAHTCIVINGYIRCNGNNEYGQLGNGLGWFDQAHFPTPTALPSETPSPTVTSSPTVTPIPTMTFTPSPTPSPTALPDPVQIDSQMENSCVVMSDHTVLCWGMNTKGQLGNAAFTDAYSATPIVVQGINNAQSVAVGNSHSCAVLTDKTIKCWGMNTEGQFGNGIADGSPQPATVSATGITTAVSVTVGEKHTCALLENGQVWCWGHNINGQVGVNSGNSVLSPAMVNLAETADAISAGNNHTCVVLSTDDIQCWGDNSSGQLGDGTNLGGSTPVYVVAGDGVSLVKGATISAGFSHTCSVQTNGRIYCWGLNTSGRLGIGVVSVDTKKAQQVINITSASSVSAGYYHTCARLTDGSVQCWGANDWGEVSPTNLGGRYFGPIAVASMTSTSSVSTGYGFTCALVGTKFKCYGKNDSGQLGTGSMFTQ